MRSSDTSIGATVGVGVVVPVGVPVGVVGEVGVGEAVAEVVSIVDALWPLKRAVIVEVPGATPVARPVLLIVATAGEADAQVTWPVRSSVELSERVPMAWNCT